MPTGNSGFLGASSQDQGAYWQDFWGPVPKITQAQGAYWQLRILRSQVRSHKLKAPTGNSGFLGASSQDHTSSRRLLATQDFWGPVPKITQAQGAYWQLRIFGGQFPRSHKLKAPTGNSGFLGASSQDHTSSRRLLATQDFWGPVPKITQAQGAYWQLRIFGGQFPRSHKLKVPTGNSGFLGASSQDHTSSRCLLATQDFWGPVPTSSRRGGQFPRSHKLKVPTGNSGFLGASSQDHTSSRRLLATQDFWGPVPKITQAQGAYWQLRIFGGPVPKIMPTGNSGFLGASSQDHTSSRRLLATQDFWGPVPKITQAQGAYWQLRIFWGQSPRSHKLKAPTGNSGLLGASSQDHASSRCLLATQDFWGPGPKITQAQGASCSILQA